MKAVSENILNYLTKDSLENHYGRLEVLGYIAAQRRIKLDKYDLDRLFEKPKLTVNDLQQALQNNEIKNQFKAIIRTKLINEQELESMLKMTEEKNRNCEEIIQHITKIILKKVVKPDEEHSRQNISTNLENKNDSRPVTATLTQQNIHEDSLSKDNEKEESSRIEEITPAANEMLRILENLSLKETPKEQNKSDKQPQSEQKSDPKPRRNRLAANFSLS